MRQASTYFTFLLSLPPTVQLNSVLFCPDITELIGTINLLPDLMAPLQKMLRGAEKALESKLKQGRADHFTSRVAIYPSSNV